MRELLLVAVSGALAVAACGDNHPTGAPDGAPAPDATSPGPTPAHRAFFFTPVGVTDTAFHVVDFFGDRAPTDTVVGHEARQSDRGFADVAWSRDGRRAVSHDHTSYVFDLGAAPPPIDAIPVTQATWLDHAGGGSSPFAPSGGYVAVYDWGVGAVQRFDFDAAGRLGAERALVTATYAQWAPVGERLAYVRFTDVHSGAAQLGVLDPATGAITEWALPTWNTGLAWSPDGRWIAAHGGDFTTSDHVYLIDTTRPAQAAIDAHPGAARTMIVDFSPDSAHLVLEEPTTHAMTFVALGDPPLARVASTHATPAQWLDATHLVTLSTSGADLAVVDVTSDAERTLVARPDAWDVIPARRAVVYHDATGGFVLPVDGGAAWPVDWGGAYPWFSRDGRWLLCASDASKLISIYDLSSGAVHRYPLGNSLASDVRGEFTDDGAMAMYSTFGAPTFVDLTTWTTFTPADVTYAPAVAWAPTPR